MRSNEAIKKMIQERKVPKEFLKWITSRHIFEFFDIAPDTLRNWRRLKKITYTRFCGIILYDAYDILEQLEAAKVVRKK